MRCARSEVLFETDSKLRLHHYLTGNECIVTRILFVQAIVSDSISLARAVGFGLIITELSGALALPA